MSIDRQSEVITDPVEDVSDVQDTAQTQVASDASEETTQPIEEDWAAKYKKLENDFKSVSGKMSATEKKAREYENAALIVDALNKAAKVDKEFMKVANKKLVEQGVLDPSVLEEPETPAPTPVTRQVDPAVEWARRKQQEEMANEARFYEKFEQDKGDITDGSPEVVAAKRRAIASAAMIYQLNGMDKAKAHEMAYIQVLHPDKLKEAGEIEGLVRAKSTPMIGGGAGGSSKETAVKLNEAQKRAARAFGMTDEEYVKWS